MMRKLDCKYCNVGCEHDLTSKPLYAGPSNANDAGILSSLFRLVESSSKF